MVDIKGKTLKPIVFKTAEGFEYFDYYDIIMCSAEGNNSIVFTLDTDVPIRILHHITFVEKKYCNEKLVRCHKSHIINLMHLEKLITKRHQIQLKRNYIVPLCENYWRIIKKISEMNISKSKPEET